MVPMNVKCLETPMRKTWTFIQKSWELIRRQQPHSAQRHGLNCVLLRKSVIRSYPWLLLLQGELIQTECVREILLLTMKETVLTRCCHPVRSMFLSISIRMLQRQPWSAQWWLLRRQKQRPFHISYLEAVIQKKSRQVLVLTEWWLPRLWRESWHLPMPPDIPSLESWLAGQSVWQ